MKKRLLSIFICVVMVLGIVPSTVLAWTAPTLSGGKAEWNVKLSDDGLLTWNDMGGTSYDIEVDETGNGFTLTKIYGVETNSYNLIDQFKELKVEHGTYYFTIKANGPDTTSGMISFKYVSPEAKLPAPQNLYWDGTVAKWDSVDGAEEYSVKLISDGGYTQLIKTTSEAQYDWSTYASDGYWFEVVATADGYRDSNSAESPQYGSFSWTAPTLSGGKAEWNVKLSDDGLLTWNDMGGTSYDIEVDETGNGITLTNIYGVETNSYNLIDRFKELKVEHGTYYFAIKANGPDTTSGMISLKYVSPEPKLSAPQNLYWDGTVAKWDSVDGAEEYSVKLISDSGYTQLIKTASQPQYDWSTYASDGYWFEVVATAGGYRDSNVAESPAYGVYVDLDKYTVTYDAGGGSGTMATEYLTVADNGFAKTYTFPQCGFTAPAGKEFDKWLWYYNDNPGNTYETAPGNSPWISGNITVKALWKDIEGTYYTVTYDAGGGSGTMATEYLTVADDGFAKTYTFPQCGFTAPAGKEFDKWLWYYNDNPGNTYETEPGNSPWLSGNITVKALWKDLPVEEYTYYYFPTEAVGSAEFDTVASGTEITLAECMFEAPEGKIFLGWAVGDINAELKQPGDKIIITGETYIYAIWNSYTISGTVKSFNDGDATIELFKDGEIVDFMDSNNSYSFSGLTEGTYTLKVSKTGHATREYEITVTGNTTQNVEIWLYGDVTKDGLVNNADTIQINRRNANLTSVFSQVTDSDYRIKVANVTAIAGVDSIINNADVIQINRKNANLNSVFSALA